MATGKARIFSGGHKIKLFKATITDFHRYKNVLNYFQFFVLVFCICPFFLVYIP
jgi:hypothetical protein